ncbi:glial cell line-derived neurotrophic family receptor-like isoform X2 [Calliopsis andreniformis]|uniref:glial cell line-derived neurotrophic family receptor-like isoform X2 n=1 Tax=Calliopsis andreniformis TaxID=337506 RepID=UPI003FCD81E9
MSRGRRGIRRRPVARRRAEERLREGRVSQRLRGLGPMVYHDLMVRVMSRVVGTLLARSTLLKSVAAALVVLSCCCRCTRASEFPERECCDLIFPIPEPTGRSTSAPTPTGRSGSDIKASVAILNCLYARQLCFEDPSCSAILEIIPRVCGPELVACSTVTVTKCQAALHTLQAFPFFRPTCLCREPHVDPDCNSFQNFLFDHPCIYVLKKDKDPFPIDALPTCNHALSVCLRDKPCSQIFEDFKSNCKAREGKCRLESRSACHDSWTQLRLSPMFGCICPNNHMKRRCDRIFSMVNHNPCVVKVISHPDNSTSFEMIESQLENPLIDVDHRDLLAIKQIPVPGGHHHKTHHKRNQTDDHDQSSVVLPSAASDLDKIQQPVKVVLSSTCHHAYTACKNDPECKVFLEPVLNHCDSANCARNECMEALQNFYKSANHKHSVEIAFCLCRKTDDKKDECIIAQEKMHPACAQRVEGAEMPTCHSLAEACKENWTCRMKLEYYEQNCAMDSVTKKCAGPTAECRKAMLGILGTELRSNCACKGTELTQLYDCLGWQRLLWVNPCVVESQKDYHARRKHHHYPRTTTTTVSSTTKSPVSTTTVTVVEQVEDNQIPEVTRWPTTEPTETWEITTTSTTTTTTTTTMSTTPSTTTTTTTPPRFCVVQRPRQSHQYIREGKGKRLYREDEPECSELCQCGEGEVLICNTICVNSLPCKTDFAFYNHEAPAYQAHRGPCLCYSGRFICMRPSPDAYSIPHGVFMFLGYSEKDESFLRQHNNLTVLDAVSSLDSFMREEVNNQTVCTLFLYNATRENVIAVARLGTDNPPPNSSQAQTLQHLLRVKEECASMLQDLSDKINNKHHEVHTHPLLSIFKMAEVEVKLPYSNEVGCLSRSSSFLLVAILQLLSLLRSASTCLLAS